MFAFKGWFLDENGNFTKTAKSKGTDGVEGTYDDIFARAYQKIDH